MSDRLAIPTMVVTARGTYPSQYKGETRTTPDGVPLKVVLVTSQVPSPWRPIPETVELEVTVPETGVPSGITDGDEVALSGVIIRAGSRQSGAAYLAATAEAVELA